MQLSVGVFQEKILFTQVLTSHKTIPLRPQTTIYIRNGLSFNVAFIINVFIIHVYIWSIQLLEGKQAVRVEAVQFKTRYENNKIRVVEDHTMMKDVLQLIETRCKCVKVIQELAITALTFNKCKIFVHSHKITNGQSTDTLFTTLFWVADANSHLKQCALGPVKIPG